MKIKLNREVKGKIRYYEIELYESIIGEFVVKAIYGNICNQKPTGSKIYYFGDFQSAEVKFNRLKESKLKRGYKK